MQRSQFRTSEGIPVPAITTAEMERVDRVAIQEFRLSLLQMMEHAGRNLARLALQSDAEAITVLAGRGGNGGGGLACARHLANRGRLDTVVCSHEREAFDGPPADQLGLLERMDIPISFGEATVPPESDLLIDALIGYGLTGSPRGTAAELITAATRNEVPVISLDVPSGIDATTGDTPGVVIDATQTCTLALPKTGLVENASQSGIIVLGDLGIPAAVYEQAEIEYRDPFGDRFVTMIERFH